MRTFTLPDGGSPSAKQSFGEVIAVHAALLSTGKILYFGGDEHDPGRYHLGMKDATRLFDCATLSVSTVTSPGISDFFCCGHAFLPSGQLLVGGGTQYWMNEVGTPGDPRWHARDGHFRGLRDTWRFDPTSETFHRVADMGPQPGQSVGGGRWYPTLMTLGDGRVIAVSGHPGEDDTEHFNYLVEAFHEDGGLGWWERADTMPYGCNLYPRCHLLPDGRVFFSTPHGDGTPQGNCYAWTPATTSWTPICPSPGPSYGGFDTTSVLLPLVPENGYQASVLLCGASGPLRVDLGAANPTWRSTGPRTLIDPGTSTSPERHNVNAVLLPTGDVAVVGGIGNTWVDPGSAVREIELYRHGTDSWVTIPAPTTLSISRSYHSVALLMPDGRVWVAGSNIFCMWSFHNTSDYPNWQDYPNPQQPTTAQDDAIDNRHLEIEIFEPWYMGRPDRPTFTLPGTEINPGAPLVIHSPQAVTISRVVLIRSGTATHSFNPDQRYVAIPYSLTSSTDLTAHVPTNSNLLPPGSYLLFILRQVVDPATGAILEVPSVGTFVHVHAPIMKRLKPEVDVPHKQLFDTLRNPKLLVELQKMIGENVVLPIEELAGERKGAAAGISEAVAQIAERIDRIGEALETSKTFVRAELRPPVGIEPLSRSFAFGAQSPPIDPMGADMGGGGGMPDHGGHPMPEGHEDQGGHSEHEAP